MKLLITNKYYITTIIAIFLSLSLGILIGGTLGQQWINNNQQKLVSYFKAKSEELQKTNQDLEKKNDELLSSYQSLKDDFQILFTKSISHTIDGRKLLWINSTNEDFESIKRSIKIAGGIIYELDHEISTVVMKGSSFSMNASKQYDAIIFVPENNEQLKESQQLAQYGIPVIYMANQSNEWIEKLDLEAEVYEQKINIESFNDQYQFITFLKNLFEEKS